MSAQRKDGGPAYPTERVIQLGGGASRIERDGGISKRDWFAGMAMCGDYDRRSPKEDAEWAYKMADAMLAARNGEEQ